MTGYVVRRVDGEATLADAHDVRRTVFIEEQGVSEAEEMDGRDDEATHVVVYETDTDRPVGTARVRYVDDETAKAERVAVRAEHRGEGLGRRLMEHLEAEAREQGCSTVDLHAQTAVEEFYASLGYETVSDEFLEAGIPHVEMEKEL
ncbi:MULTISPECIES: GNAT family N-acetyltransferase [Salinibaculum]|uniref:GNAT family N-acetyltransferase n=1 Tax=Salinibaculum TaxID=2732368 RepID=UPI0030CD6076